MTWAKGYKLHRDKYTIESKLGTGRFGVTYRARDKQNNYVVIKTLNDNSLQKKPPEDREKLKASFYNEALKLEKCKHRHIVKVREIVTDNDFPCIVMEYIDGNDLAKRAQPILPEGEALRYIRQIGQALKEVHKQGLLHRDLKPDNIMRRCQKGKVEAVLIDFGLARECNHPLTEKWQSDGFTPIELYSEKLECGTWTDVYGLAATLYVLLTGKQPENADERYDKENTKELTPPKQYNRKISDRTNQAILKGMAIKPCDRTQTIDQWLKLLGINPILPFTVPEWNIDRSIQLAIAIGTVVAAIVGLWTLIKPSTSPETSQPVNSEEVRQKN
ncbi:MAG: serine/threonine-protein kinase [Oscillatoria sp. PMC 1068.18]|nr:serine/threonine-protein kinase [Oscillatoria sp. PMC 1076.18]MEC4987441.1 serine/threonine-protein kinase [Oscillatoria sp. PMC 1068.18]